MPIDSELLFRVLKARKCYEFVFQLDPLGSRSSRQGRSDWDSVFSRIKEGKLSEDELTRADDFDAAKLRKISEEEMVQFKVQVVENRDYPLVFYELRRVLDECYGSLVESRVKELIAARKKSTDKASLSKNALIKSVKSEVHWYCICNAMIWLKDSSTNPTQLIDEKVRNCIERNCKRCVNPSELWTNLQLLRELGLEWDEFEKKIGCPKDPKKTKAPQGLSREGIDKHRAKFVQNELVEMSEDESQRRFNFLVTELSEDQIEKFAMQLLDEICPYPDAFKKMLVEFMDRDKVADLYAMIECYSREQIEYQRRLGQTQHPELDDVIHEFYLLRVFRLAKSATRYHQKMQATNKSSFAQVIFNSFPKDACRAYNYALANAARKDSIRTETQKVDFSLRIAPRSNPLDQIIEKETKEVVGHHIEAFLESLDDVRDRQIFYMYHLEGYSSRELAQIFGVTQQRVYQLLSVITQRLREFGPPPGWDRTV